MSREEYLAQLQELLDGATDREVEQIFWMVQELVE